MSVEARSFVDIDPARHEWAVDQAASEEITPGQLVDRALERERRRLSGQRQLDSRTRMVGVKGSRSTLGAGQLITKDFHELARSDEGTLTRLEAMGALAPLKKAARGTPAVWSERMVPAFMVLSEVLEVAPGLPVDRYEELGRLLGNQTRDIYRRGRFVIVSMELEPRLMSWEHLADAVCRWRATVVVIDLGRIGAELDGQPYNVGELPRSVKPGPSQDSRVRANA